MTSRPAFVRRTRRISNSRGVRSSALAVDASFVPDGIELERSGRDPAITVGDRARRPPERHPKAGIQLVDAERLGDVVVGTALQGLDLLALLVPAGQDHDRRRRLAPDAAHESSPSMSGRPEVQQDDVRPAALPAKQRRAAVGRLDRSDSRAP